MDKILAQLVRREVERGNSSPLLGIPHSERALYASLVPEPVVEVPRSRGKHYLVIRPRFPIERVRLESMGAVHSESNGLLLMGDVSRDLIEPKRGKAWGEVLGNLYTDDEVTETSIDKVLIANQWDRDTTLRRDLYSGWLDGQEAARQQKDDWGCLEPFGKHGYAPIMPHIPIYTVRQVGYRLGYLDWFEDRRGWAPQHEALLARAAECEYFDIFATL